MRAHIQIQDQQTNRLSSPVESLIHLDSIRSSITLQSKEIDIPMTVQIKTQHEQQQNKMAEKIKGSIVTEIDNVVDSPSTIKQFKRKARYSNGGVVVKKSEASNNMKVISIIQDAAPDKTNQVGTVLRLNSGKQNQINQGFRELAGVDQSLTPILQQIASFQSFVESVGSSPREADKRTIHLELFGSPLLVTQMINSDRTDRTIASSDKLSSQNHQNLTVQLKKRFDSTIEKSVKEEVTRMRQQMAKFPNSKPETKHYQNGQQRTRSDQLTNLKYTKRKKAQQLHIDLTQLNNLDKQRGGGGCAAGNFNGAQFQDHFGFFPDIHNSLRQENTKEEDFFSLKEQKQFKMRQALQLRAERVKNLQQSLKFKLNQKAVTKLPKDQRERVEQTMLEEWTIEGKKQDIIQALSPKQALRMISPIRENMAYKAYINGRNRVSFAVNHQVDPVAQISSILMSKADLVQQVIASAARAKQDEFSRNVGGSVLSPRNITVEHLQQHSNVNNQKIQTDDHDTSRSSRPSLNTAHKTHSQNVKKRHAFDVNPFHQDSKQLLPAASLQRISPESKISKRILKCDSTGSFQTNKTTKSVHKAHWPPVQSSMFQDQPEGFAEANPDLLMFQMLKSKKQSSPRLDLQTNTVRRQGKPQAIELLLVKQKHFY